MAKRGAELAVIENDAVNSSKEIVNDFDGFRGFLVRLKNIKDDFDVLNEQYKSLERLSEHFESEFYRAENKAGLRNELNRFLGNFDSSTMKNIKDLKSRVQELKAESKKLMSKIERDRKELFSALDGNVSFLNANFMRLWETASEKSKVIESNERMTNIMRKEGKTKSEQRIQTSLDLDAYEKEQRKKGVLKRLFR